MARSTGVQRPDWLRPTRLVTRQAEARPDLLPQVTNPEARDLFWSTVLAMAVGGLFGFAIVMGLAS